LSRGWPGRALVVWGVLGALTLTIGALEYRDRFRAAPGPEADAGRLLPVPVDQLTAVEVANRGQLHRFERDAAGTWFYHGMHTAAAAEHTHEADPALAERIDRAFAALGRARVERQFPLEGDGAAYGVAAPEVVILVYRARDGQPLAQYAVGHVAPDTASRYVAAVGTRRVLTVPAFHIDSLLALVQSAAEASAR
jgi:hypothetical protein